MDPTLSALCSTSGGVCHTATATATATPNETAMLISCIWGLAEAVSSAVCSAAAGLRSIVRSGADAGEVRVVAKESAMLALWAVGKGTRSAMELFQAAAYRLEALGSAIEHHASNNSMAAVAAEDAADHLLRFSGSVRQRVGLDLSLIHI